MAKLADALWAAQDAATAAAEGGIAETLEAAMRAAVSRYEADDVVALPAGFRDDLGRVLSVAWSEAARASGRAVRAEWKAADGIETKAEEDDEAESLFDRIADAFVQQYGAAKVSRIMEATRDQIMRHIQDGLREGLGTEAIAKRLRDDIPEMARLRAHVIARTESHQASTFAAMGVARTVRFPLVKRWIAVRDHRTRDFGEGDGVVDTFSHRAMHGVKVPMEQPFFVPTRFGTREPLMQPGDPAGSAGNTIMCRCTVAFERAEQ